MQQRSVYRWASIAEKHNFLAIAGVQHRLALVLVLSSFFATIPCLQAQVPGAIAASQSQGPSQAASTQPQSPPSTPVQSVGAITLTKIADRAEDLERLLDEINSQLVPNSELLDASKKAEEDAKEIETRAVQTKELLMGAPTPLELEDELRFWRVRSLDYQTQRETLTAQAGKLEEQIQLLETQRQQWQATWNEINQLRAIQAIVDRVRQELDAIGTVQTQAQDQLNLVLVLQNQVSRQDQKITDILQAIRQSREARRRRIFQPDTLPLWKFRQLRQLDQTSGGALHRSLDRSYTTAGEFLRAHTLATLGLVVCYFLALLGVYRLRRYVARAPSMEIPAEAQLVLKRPFAVALLVALLGTGQYPASAPIGITFLFYLLFLIPVWRLLIPLAESKLRPDLYALSVLSTVEVLYLLVQLPLLLRRELYTLIVLAALVTLGWLARPSRLGPLAAMNRQQRIFVIAIRTVLPLLAASLLANAIGFVSLAQVLGLTALLGPFVGAALYCGAYVLIVLLKTALRTNRARDLLEIWTVPMERWGVRLLTIGAGLLWLKAMLRLLTVHEAVMAAISKVFQYPIGVERVHFTLGGVLSIVLILLCGYLIARIFTLLLNKLVLPRLPLQRGLPYAISTVTYYILLVVVALAALSAAGVELNKFTVLTGALGVGLGFGLQNIVNNFVSGVILLFERPIHVDDTVEVGGLVGVVRRIGARSSTVVTFQGAEVIVPNSNLLSNQVINWTLSSQLRRVDIPVGIAYGTDPERVISILVQVARAHPDVLRERPPAAFFLGFGESALNFELRFWSARQDTWFQLQSDVAVSVEKALREAGITIPFPQRDLHLRIDATTAEALAGNELPNTTIVGTSKRGSRG
jgi:small-conductance mechanosensitive channel